MNYNYSTNSGNSNHNNINNNQQMANHGLTNEQARQIGAKTLWIGDIEPWMDENYIQGLFNGVSNR